MEDDFSDVDFECEIEVDEDMKFDEEELEKFNSYESTEVQFPSDITLDEFDLEEEEELVSLESIPMVLFVDDHNVRGNRCRGIFLGGEK